MKISVIVPVYKVPLEYLRACFDSLTAQTMQECEFIVVSDGAPEAECSVCEEYATKDSRFKFFKRDHCGVSATRNFGIDQAQGEYITFVDSDDYLLNKEALTTINKFINEQPDILLLNWKESINQTLRKPLEEPNPILSIKQKQQCISDFIFSRENGVSGAPWAKIYKRQHVNNYHIRFNTNFSIGEDRVFNYDAFSHNCIVAYQDYIFYYYRIIPQSLSQKRNSYSPFHFLPYIKELKRHSNNNYPIHIAKETVSMLYKSWIHYYNTVDYSKFLTKRYFDFLRLILSKDIRHLANLNIKTIFQISLDFLKYKTRIISSFFAKK